VIANAEALLARSVQEEGKGFRGFSDEARRALLAHRWPGNVRELENVVRTAVVLNEGELVEAEMLPLRESAPEPPALAPAVAASPPLPPVAPLRGLPSAEVARLIRPLADIEREAIERAVELCDGNIPKAAAHLGISPSTLYRKRAAWGAAAE
jgi:two-component system repressor protein LuxO